MKFFPHQIFFIWRGKFLAVADAGKSAWAVSFSAADLIFGAGIARTVSRGFSAFGARRFSATRQILKNVVSAVHKKSGDGKPSPLAAFIG
jgi:hypothetical protein